MNPRNKSLRFSQQTLIKNTIIRIKELKEDNLFKNKKISIKNVNKTKYVSGKIYIRNTRMIKIILATTFLLGRQWRDVTAE